jgi:PBSX family phage terminase large subunit
MEKTYSQTYKRTPKYDRYIKDSVSKTWNILEGSIRSSKSAANVLAFATNLLISKDNLHMLCATTSIAARQIWLENDGLGLLHIFKGISKEKLYSGHPSLEIDLGDRTVTVLLMGLQNTGSYRAFRGFSLGMVGWSEIDLLDPESVIESINRTAASKHRRMFADLNPTAPGHQIYGNELMYSIERLKEANPDGVNYLHVTMKDNPVMSQTMIAEVLKDYDPESVEYERFILGRRVAAYDTIYRLRDYNVVKDINPRDYVEYVISADPGQNNSATVFILLGITKGYKSVDVLREYYHKNADTNRLGIKMPVDYANDLADFIDESILYMGKYPAMVYTDLDLTFQRELLQALKKKKMNNITFKGARKEEIEERIRMGISLLYTGKLRFSDKCEKTIDAFKKATYDPRQSVKGVYVRLDDPSQGTEIDAIDATEYAIEHFINKIYRR